MKIDESMRVPIDYNDKELALAIRELKPVVFRDGDSYCTLYGPNPQMGIFGRGDSVSGSLADWENDLRERLANAADDDEVVNDIKELLRNSGIQTW